MRRGLPRLPRGADGPVGLGARSCRRAWGPATGLRWSWRDRRPDNHGCTTTCSGRIERCSCVHHARDHLSPSQFMAGPDVYRSSAVVDSLINRYEPQAWNADQTRARVPQLNGAPGHADCHRPRSAACRRRGGLKTPGHTFESCSNPEQQEPVRAENRDTVPYQRLCGHTADRPRSRRPARAQHDLPLWPSDSRT